MNNQQGIQCTGYEAPSGLTRRAFWQRFAGGLGGLALHQLWQHESQAGTELGVLTQLHHPPRAKRVICIFQAGGPSQLETFDYKPALNERHGTELPDSVRRGQRLTGMSANQASLPLVGSAFKFQQYGESGAWVSELFPHTAKIVDELCVVRSLYTEAINHGPAVTYFQTGAQIPGRPSIGAWLNYGLGTENADLPAFVVLITNKPPDQPLSTRLWGNGFLPSRFQGVRFRADKDPVLYLNNPPGVNSANRRAVLDTLNQLHQHELDTEPSADIETRVAQYELSYRMQNSIPAVTRLEDEPEYVFEEYGEGARQAGTFAANCILARRLAERGVRFIQLYHPGWDHHGGLPKGMRGQSRETDQASAALVLDLKRRGLLDDTLVIWGGEFGRTSYCQGKLVGPDYGRDHHPRCFSIWMAGGGVRSGLVYGQTDDFGYNIEDKPVHLHDLHATILHTLGIDHEQLTFRYQGRRFRLTDVHGVVQHELLS